MDTKQKTDIAAAALAHLDDAWSYFTPMPARPPVKLQAPEYYAYVRTA